MDENLLELLRNKPEKGLEMLMNSYMGLVYAIVYNKIHIVCTREDIEDCVSSVFQEAYLKREDIDLTKGSLKAFLAVVAKRRAIDIYRKVERIENKVISIEELTGTENNPVLIEDTGNVPDRETKAVLIDSIKALGEPDSEIFIRKYYIGQSTKMISKAMGLKGNTIDKRVSRGLVKLRDVLKGVL